MSSDYILVGFINIFNIIPDFVVPVFKNAIENLYCIQYIEDDKIVLDKFSDFNESFYLSNVEFYNILDSKYEQVDLEKNDILKSFLDCIISIILHLINSINVFVSPIWMNQYLRFRQNAIYFMERQIPL